MKVLLINQNPVIKKLVGMAGKKLNLDIENVARIAQGFRANDYICIIVDDDSVGKNLELLTAMQDKVKVCLLFARQTQIKKHEFNIAIQKPFLPTDILEILNDCIPKENEINKLLDNAGNSDTEYDDIQTNEIDIDLKSAEIEPPGGIDLVSASLQKEAEQIANQDAESMLDFDPDSLDLSDLEPAEEVQNMSDMKDDGNETEIHAENNAGDNDNHMEGNNSPQDSHTESKVPNEYDEKHHVSIFDSDLSDLKPSNDNALDLENFDLDSIMDASALEEASLGIPTQIEKEAREVASSIDDDDLFLSDDERELLQPSPKRFMQARKEEEQKENELNDTKEQGENNINNIKQETADSANEAKVDSKASDNIVVDNKSVLDSELHEFNDENPQDIQNKSKSTLDAMQVKNDSKDDNIDSDDINNLELPLITDDTFKEIADTKDIIDIKEDFKPELVEHSDLKKDNLEKVPPKDNTLNGVKKDDSKSFEEDIDAIDLSMLDETMKMQETQKDSTSSTLDEAFDDLTAALNSAFDNISFDIEPNKTQSKSTDAAFNQEADSKENKLSESDMANVLENTESSKETTTKPNNDLENLDLEGLTDINMGDKKDENSENDLLGHSLDGLETSDLNELELAYDLEADYKENKLSESDIANVLENTESSKETTTKPNNDLENLDLEGLTDMGAENISLDVDLNEKKVQSETTEEVKQDIDSSLDALLQMDVLQENDNNNNQGYIENDLDIETLRINDELNLTQKDGEYLGETTILNDETIDSKSEQSRNDVTLDVTLSNNDGVSEAAVENGNSDIDLETMLDTNDLTQEYDMPNSSIIPQETIAEVNEALKSINEDSMGIDVEDVEADAKADLDSQNHASDIESVDTSTYLGYDDNVEENLLSDLLGESRLNGVSDEEVGYSAEIRNLKTDLETIQDLDTGEHDFISASNEETEVFDMQLDSIKSSVSVPQNQDSILKQKESLDNDTHAKYTEQQTDTKLTYVTLPSNEDSIEKLTETELAEALGESETPIMRLKQTLDTENDTKDLADIEESKQDTTKHSAEHIKNDLLGDTSTQDEESKQNVIKELDANSLIDLFKNTPKDKLHEIFDGSEITFNIRFGKNSQ